MSIKSPFKDAVETRVRTKSGAGAFSGADTAGLPAAASDMGSPGGQPIVQHSRTATPVQGLPSLKPEGRIFKLSKG